VAEKPSKGAKDFASQPIWFKDGPPPTKDILWDMHISGQPMIQKERLNVASGDMKSLHKRVLRQELELLKLKHPAYPIFAVKVPKVLGFVDRSPGDLFYLRFDDIFNMLNMKRLSRNMVCLFVLSLAYQVIREKTPGIAILDPYFMVESTFASPEG
jgi:hypothetical protein